MKGDDVTRHNTAMDDPLISGRVHTGCCGAGRGAELSATAVR